MQSPVASRKCLSIGLVLCLLLVMPIFLMMFVDVNATPLPQHIATAHAPHHASGAAKPAGLPPASHPLP